MPGSGLQEIMVRVYCLLIGCAFGLFQSAYFLGKIKGIDIRDYGSGNSGMTNTLRTLGTKAGLIVLVCDMLKIVLAVTLTTCLFAGKYPELRYTLKLYTAIGCIIGHNYPFYMRFPLCEPRFSVSCHRLLCADGYRGKPWCLLRNERAASS